MTPPKIERQARRPPGQARARLRGRAAPGPDRQLHRARRQHAGRDRRRRRQGPAAVDPGRPARPSGARSWPSSSRTGSSPTSSSSPTTARPARRSRRRSAAAHPARQAGPARDVEADAAPATSSRPRSRTAAAFVRNVDGRSRRDPRRRPPHARAGRRARRLRERRARQAGPRSRPLNAAIAAACKRGGDLQSCRAMRAAAGVVTVLVLLMASTAQAARVDWMPTWAWAWVDDQPFVDPNTGAALPANSVYPRGQIKDRGTPDCCAVKMTITALGTGGQQLHQYVVSDGDAVYRSLDQRLNLGAPVQSVRFDLCLANNSQCETKTFTRPAPAVTPTPTPGGGGSPADGDAAADRAGGPRRRHLPGHDRLQRHELVGAPRRPRVSRQRPRRRLQPAATRRPRCPAASSTTGWSRGGPIRRSVSCACAMHFQVRRSPWSAPAAAARSNRRARRPTGSARSP